MAADQDFTDKSLCRFKLKNFRKYRTLVHECKTSIKDHNKKQVDSKLMDTNKLAMKVISKVENLDTNVQEIV